MEQHVYQATKSIGEVVIKFETTDFEAMREFLTGQLKPTELLVAAESTFTSGPLPISYDCPTDTHYSVLVLENGKVITDNRVATFEEAEQIREHIPNLMSSVLPGVFTTEYSLEKGKIEETFVIMPNGEIIKEGDVKALFEGV